MEQGDGAQVARRRLVAAKEKETVRGVEERDEEDDTRYQQTP